MHEEIMYPVCPHRNVPAAFQRFLGPDSGGMERFFPDERAQRTDGTLLIVRQRGRKAFTAAVQAIVEINAGLSGVWIAGVSVLSALASHVRKDAAALIRRCAFGLFGARPVRLPV